MCNLTRKEQAWQQISLCCQTWCERDKVISYIQDLEDRNRLLEQKLEQFALALRQAHHQERHNL